MLNSNFIISKSSSTFLHFLINIYSTYISSYFIPLTYSITPFSLQPITLTPSQYSHNPFHLNQLSLITNQFIISILSPPTLNFIFLNSIYLLLLYTHSNSYYNYFTKSTYSLNTHQYYSLILIPY